MKKLLALLLALVMVLSLAACGTAGSGDETKGTEGGETAKGSVYYLNFKPEFDTALQQLGRVRTGSDRLRNR